MKPECTDIGFVRVMQEEIMMKRKTAVTKLTSIMAALGVTFVMLSGCGKAPEQDGADTSVSYESNDAAENQDSSNNADSEKVEDNNTGTKPITLLNHKVSCQQDGKELCNGSYTEIILSSEFAQEYPKLSAYLDERNQNFTNTCADTAAEYGNWKLQDTFTGDEPYADENLVEIVRADDRIFTIVSTYYSYAGGAHPNHGTSVTNIDPISGAELSLAQVLQDTEGFAKIMRDEFIKEYPDVIEEVDSYYYYDDGAPDVFQNKLDENTYSWTITDKGLNIFFSPYEIASYATGYMQVTIDLTKYPDLVQKAYQQENPFNKDEMIEEKEGEEISVEHKEAEDAYEGSSIVTIANPTWEAFVSENQTKTAESHIKLTQTKEEKTDWLDTGKWAMDNGFDLARPEYSDEIYYYSPYASQEYEYMYGSIIISSLDGENVIADYDLTTLCNGPDEKAGKNSAATQYLRYAKIDGDVLYLAVGHAGYSAEEPQSNYIVAVDLNTNEILFRTEPLMCNSDNFKIVDDTIICGYGFTLEPDAIYLLDKYTGKKYDEVKVNSAPYQFEIVDDTLYVATYNTAYEFKIEK